VADNIISKFTPRPPNPTSDQSGATFAVALEPAAVIERFKPGARSHSAEPVTVTVLGAVARTGISRATIYRLAHDGHIRMIKVGRRSLIVWSTMLDYLGKRPLAELRQAA
jgi:excisionase family DNA binding protein